MEEEFNIYIDRLKNGKEEPLALSLAPQFMEIHESDLAFERPIHIHGIAYLTDGAVIVQIKIETEVSLSCSVCNKPTQVKISLPHVVLTEEVENIRGRIFNFKDLLREQILLEVPHLVECNNGCCPERANMAKFLKKNGEAAQESYHPFRDL